MPTTGPVPAIVVIVKSRITLQPLLAPKRPGILCRWEGNDKTFLEKCTLFGDKGLGKYHLTRKFVRENKFGQHRFTDLKIFINRVEKETRKSIDL